MNNDNRETDDLFNFDSDDDFTFDDDDLFGDDEFEVVEPKQKSINSMSQLTHEELKQLIKDDEHNEGAWFWLAMLSENPEEQKTNFKKVLEINPFNLRAHIALRTSPSK